MQIEEVPHRFAILQASNQNCKTTGTDKYLMNGRRQAKVERHGIFSTYESNVYSEFSVNRAVKSISSRLCLFRVLCNYQIFVGTGKTLTYLLCSTLLNVNHIKETVQ
jgi:hypothetical protein